MPDGPTQAELDEAWLLERIPDATINEREAFVERVAVLADVMSDELTARGAALSAINRGRRDRDFQAGR